MTQKKTVKPARVWWIGVIVVALFFGILLSLMMGYFQGFDSFLRLQSFTPDQSTEGVCEGTGSYIFSASFPQRVAKEFTDEVAGTRVQRSHCINLAEDACFGIFDIVSIDITRSSLSTDVQLNEPPIDAPNLAAGYRWESAARAIWGCSNGFPSSPEPSPSHSPESTEGPLHRVELDWTCELTENQSPSPAPTDT